MATAALRHEVAVLAVGAETMQVTNPEAVRPLA